ncbi:hypothetical protein PRIPAC_96740 [Pristionchus pacificus]|uniref:Uncharacterized protein n=1 Tax=Pristionchus pacificus TaxID=54126 RepID=A0A2A6CGY3_PRIPA|nr:hypothetical protein PRIPAC_96740 [Pristionchus pacificus]|eukprot:PDM77389.1 hypothetical protein PRIPAC_33119 [Pristionchus pacificus]
MGIYLPNPPHEWRSTESASRVERVEQHEHGAALKKVGGTLKEGLLIAPDEPETAAHYCAHRGAGDEGILFVGDVALGKVQCPLREGFESVKALGCRFPNSAGQWLHPHGYIVPLGQAIEEVDYPREYHE